MNESTVSRGRRLESEIAEYFRREGYDVQVNARALGSDGVTYEIDVLARRGGVVADRVLVECKNWSAQVSKEVITRAARARDVGLFTHAVVIAMGGTAPGALALADSAGVTVWDKAEVARRLGQSITDDIHRPIGRQELGLPLGFEFPMLDRMAMSRRRGWFYKEKLEQIAIVHLPTFEFEVSQTRERKNSMFSKDLVSQQTWTWYEGLTGLLVTTARSSVPAVQEVSVEVGLSPRKTPVQLAKLFESALAKHARAKRQDAKRTAQAALRRMGLPSDGLPDKTTVKYTRSVFLPFGVGIYKLGSEWRAETWAAWTPQPRHLAGLSQSLTSMAVDINREMDERFGDAEFDED